LQFLRRRLGGAAALINFQDLCRHRVEATPGDPRIERVRIFTNGFNIKHLNYPSMNW